jgi:hypothetical protein
MLSSPASLGLNATDRRADTAIFSWCTFDEPIFDSFAAAGATVGLLWVTDGLRFRDTVIRSRTSPLPNVRTPSRHFEEYRGHNFRYFLQLWVTMVKLYFTTPLATPFSAIPFIVRYWIRHTTLNARRTHACGISNLLTICVLQLITDADARQLSKYMRNLRSTLNTTRHAITQPCDNFQANNFITNIVRLAYDSYIIIIRVNGNIFYNTDANEFITQTKMP